MTTLYMVLSFFIGACIGYKLGEWTPKIDRYEDYIISKEEVVTAYENPTKSKEIG